MSLYPDFCLPLGNSEDDMDAACFRKEHLLKIFKSFKGEFEESTIFRYHVIQNIIFAIHVLYIEVTTFA